MFKKRFFSYIIDFLILGCILIVINSFIPVSDRVNNLSSELLSLSESFIKNEIGGRAYLSQYASIFYSIDKETFLTTLIDVVVSILYFVVYPLYNGDVGANALIFRYLPMYSIGVSILSMCSLFIFKDMNYLIITLILAFLQFLVVIISVFMVIYRNKSLPDLVAGTKVIEVKE